MTDSYLIQGACVLTLGNRTQNHASADVLIEDGVVSELGTGLRARGAEVIDGNHTIVMPGFVDAHRRCWPSLYKNDGATGRVPDIGTPTPQTVYVGTLLSLLGATDAGITTVVDWYDGPDSDAHVDAVVRAHAESRIRTVLVLATGSDRGGLWRRTVDRHGVTPSSLTTLAAGSPPLAGSNPGDLESVWDVARSLGLRIHAIAGPPENGKMADLGSRGMLGPDVTVSHITGLAGSDLDTLADAHVGIALTPTSDMTTGPGTPPMQDLLDRGIRPGLGVDHEFVAPGDVLAQIRAAISIQHARYFDLKLAGKGGLPNLLSTRDVIKYGTISGAEAAGLGTVTGSIEVGKRADLLVLRTDRPNIHPVNDPIGAVVWGIDTSNLDWVFVDGVPVLAEGRLASDVDEMRSLAVAARAQTVRATTGGQA